MVSKVSDDKIQRAMEQIAEMTDHDLPRIPESVFRDRFLPAIIGDPSAVVDISEYLKVVGGPNGRCVVVSDADRVELYRVPPFYAPIRTNDNRTARQSITEIMSYANERGKVIPRQREAAMRNLMSQVDNAIDPQSDFVTGWTEILNRYNLPNGGTSSTGDASGGDSSQPYTGEYDEA